MKDEFWEMGDLTLWVLPPCVHCVFRSGHD